MPSKADILADLRASLAAIEAGEAVPGEDDAPAWQGAASARDAERPAGQGRGPCRSTGVPSLEAASATFAADGAGTPEGKAADDAFRKILRWVSVRERSTAYVRERLLKDEFPPEAMEEAVARAVGCRAVDDRRYGDALIRMKLAAGRGLRDAEAEIEALGIDPASLDAWQEHAERGREAEVGRALAVLRRRPPRAKAAREAAFRKLVGQGYGTDIASTAARLWYEEARAADSIS